MTRNEIGPAMRALKQADRERRLKVKQEALERQNFQCSICRTPLPQLGKNTHYDHCHRTGAFRAVLCGLCNGGLGLFRDDPSLLRKAALYLELHG